jgi:hypothetical protein
MTTLNRSYFCKRETLMSEIICENLDLEYNWFFESPSNSVVRRVERERQFSIAVCANRKSCNLHRAVRHAELAFERPR